MTLNVGVCWEQYEDKKTNKETFVKIDDQGAARVGAIRDSSGQSRSKLSASFGQ